MDLSSLPVAQQQQLEQLQQKFKEHQAQRQQEEEQQQQLQLQQQQQQHYQQQQQQQNQHYASSQAYDPSQVQAYDHSQYDPSHASYYSYYQYPQQHSQQHPQQNQLQHHHQEQQHQHQHYAYDQSGYANAYQQHPVQHESGPVHTEGVAVSREGASSQMMDGGGGSGQGQVQHQQNVYYPHDLGDQRQHQHLQHQSLAAAAAEVVAAAAYPELNPAAAAAVAALSQLAQFAGNMDAAERAMTELQGRHSYGNGERFGRMMGPAGPFMGPGRMHQLVGQPPFRGGGRRGGGPFRGGNRENFRHSHPRSGGSGPPFRGRGRSRGRGGPRRFPSHNASSESSQPDPSAADDAESTGEEEDPSAAEPEEALEAEARTVTSPSASVPGMATPNPRPPQAVWCELCRVDCNSLEILEQHKNGKKHKKNLQKIEELKTADKPGAGIRSEQNPEAGSHQEVSLQSETVQVTENLPTDSTADENIMNIEQHTDSVQQPAEGTSDLQASNLSNNVRRGTKRKMRGGRGGKRMRSFEASRHPYEPPRPKVVIPIICDLCNVKCDTQEVFDRHLAGKKHISKLKRFEGHQAMYGPMVQALYPPNPIAQTLYHPQGQPPPFYGTQSLYPPPGPYMPPPPHQAAAAPMPVNSISASEGMGSYPLPNNTTIGNEQVKAIMLTDYGATAGNVSFPGLDIQAKEG